MKIKYNFNGLPVEEIRNILNYNVSSTSYLEDDRRSCVGIFMCKPMHKETQAKLAILCRNSSFYLKDIKVDNVANFNIMPEVAEIFMLKLDKPYYFNFTYAANINFICRSFETIMSYIGENNLEFMFGIYDAEHIYKDGVLYLNRAFFDCAYDYSEHKPIVDGDTMSLQKLNEYLQYVAYCHNNIIDVYTGNEAKKHFKSFYNTYYLKTSKNGEVKFKKTRYFSDFSMILAVKKFEIAKIPKKEIVLEEGADFLKLTFSDDNLVVVFNTAVADRALTVETFKKSIVRALVKASGNVGRKYVDISGLFGLREFDLENGKLNMLLFNEKMSNNPMDFTFLCNVYVQCFSESKMPKWQKNTSITFKDEYAAFLRELKKEDYQQINENSFHSLVHRNNFCFGSEEQCGYLVYTT